MRTVEELLGKIKGISIKKDNMLTQVRGDCANIAQAVEILTAEGYVNDGIFIKCVTEKVNALLVCEAESYEEKGFLACYLNDDVAA